MSKIHIIFDNDGVNIDSEDVAMRVMNDWAAVFVRSYKPDANLPKDYIYTTYPGTSSNKIVEVLIHQFDLPLAKIAKDHGLIEIRETLEDVSLALADLITIETNNRFQTELKSIPGVTQALAEIHKMFGSENVALMTTSRADRMDISLAYVVDPITGENARLEEMFPKGSQRRSGYGHTNKYDEGFEALGWNPAESIIVEDSLSGVTKAKAGRPEVSVIGTVAARFYSNKPMHATVLLNAGADIVITSISDLPLAAKWIKDGKPDTKPNFKSEVFWPNLGLSPSSNICRVTL